jgi:inward rectifier potassium channel
MTDVTTPIGIEEPKDLGFGSVVGRQNEKRLLNRDGTFNVERSGLRIWESWSIYHAALTVTWGRFLGVFALTYLVLNATFAVAYTLCGPRALIGTTSTGLVYTYEKAFFFSVHTLATIGYGNVAPVGLPANIVVTIESLCGLLGFALATGLVFARFSRPTGRFVFSERAVVAPYRGITAFMFRVANGRSNQMFELEAKLLYSRLEGRDGVRKYDQLDLERSRVVFFPLSWTIVHPINEKSPLNGLTAQDLKDRDAEFLILLSGIDETFSLTVHARSSYKPEEVIFGAKFSNIYNPITPEGVLSIDVARLNDIEPAPLDLDPLTSETSTWHHTASFVGYAPPRRRSE